MKYMAIGEGARGIRGWNGPSIGRRGTNSPRMLGVRSMESSTLANNVLQGISTFDWVLSRDAYTTPVFNQSPWREEVKATCSRLRFESISEKQFWRECCTLCNRARSISLSSSSSSRANSSEGGASESIENLLAYNSFSINTDMIPSGATLGRSLREAASHWCCLYCLIYDAVLSLRALTLSKGVLETARRRSSGDR